MKSLATPSENPEIPAGHKLTFRQKIGYALGAMTENNMQNAVPTMMMPVMNIIMGVNPILLGWAAAIPRILDAFSDPVVGYLSDKTRSRWGRRKPYLVVGALSSALVFFGMWMFPASGKSEVWYFGYFLTASLIYYSCTSLYCIPYISMGYELSDDYHERTRLMAYRMFFVTMGNFLLQWVFWFIERPWFGGGLYGMRWAAVIIGVLFLLCALGPLCLTGKTSASERKHQELAKKIRICDIFSAVRVWPFLSLQLTMLFGIIGGVGGGMMMYLCIYYLYAGDRLPATALLGILGTGGTILNLLALPLVSGLSRCFGKKYTLLLFMFLGFLGYVGSWVLYTPEWPYLCMASYGLIGMSTTALWMLIFAMTPDVCDYDEYKNSLRREGIFASVLSWTVKAGISISVILSGYVLAWTEFNPALTIQTTETLTRMRLIYALLPGGGILLGMLFIAWYPLSQKKLEWIKSETAKRAL